MGRALAETFPETAALFERSSEVLGGEFIETLFNADADELKDTRIAQPAVFLVSMAAAEALRSLGVAPSGVAGHSLGEYSALVAAGALTFEDGLRIVRERGRLMSECAARSKGGMAAILGMALDELEALVAETARTCLVEIANINSPGQVVVSGEETSVEKFSEIALQRGAKKAVRLKVSGAFHSALMAPVADELRRLFEEYRFASPRVPFVSNVTGDFVRESSEIKRLLAEQVRRPVLWSASMNRFVEAGSRTFVEVGPGRVLKGLMRRISSSGARVLSADEPETLRKSAQEILGLEGQIAVSSS
jgi:[acyl-carrier-protein] S-malonyltransferase